MTAERSSLTRRQHFGPLRRYQATRSRELRKRNLEAGVVLDDAHFAKHLAKQWLGLIDAGVVGEWRVPA